MDEMEIKKNFINSLCRFMQEAITSNSSGEVDGKKVVHLSPRGASIVCDLPENFFRSTTIDPTTIEIKFNIKK